MYDPAAHQLRSLDHDRTHDLHPARPAASVAEGEFSRACPACSDKVFRRWPWGWDAHAAYRCEGLEATCREKRKREFRERFGRR